MAAAAPSPAVAAAVAATSSPLVNVFRLCGVESVCAPSAAAVTKGLPPPPPPTAAAASTTANAAAKKDATAAKADDTAAATAAVGRLASAGAGYERSGRVAERMDADIGKRVMRIGGTISAGALDGGAGKVYSVPGCVLMTQFC